MSNNVHPVIQPILEAFFPSRVKKITIGMCVDTKHGKATITGIEMVEPGHSDGGIEMTEIWACDKDRCVFDLDNGHWAYGDQITLVNS